MSSAHYWTDWRKSRPKRYSMSNWQMSSLLIKQSHSEAVVSLMIGKTTILLRGVRHSFGLSAEDLYRSSDVMLDDPSRTSDI